MSEFDFVDCDLYHRMQGNPVLRAMGRRSMLQGTGYRILKAEDVLAERLVFGLSILNREVDIYYGEGSRGDVPDEFRVRLAELAVASIPFLWMPEIYRVALDGTLPDHVVSPEVLPLPRMWFTWPDDQPVTLPGVIDVPTPSRFWALLIVDGAVSEITRFRGWDSGLTVVLFGAPDDGPAAIWLSGIPYLSRYPIDEEARGAEWLLQMFAFLNSPLVCPREQKAPRPLRRQADRAPEIEVAVRFVELRSIISRPGRERSDDPGQVDQDWRTLVRGHYRAQWYPSEGAHHVIRIEPYLKGPEGAPLRPRAYRVSR
jgi:hypothetical protein